MGFFLEKGRNDCAFVAGSIYHGRIFGGGWELNVKDFIRRAPPSSERTKLNPCTQSTTDKIL
jgi:hypothetical protein